MVERAHDRTPMTDPFPTTIEPDTDTTMKTRLMTLAASVALLPFSAAAHEFTLHEWGTFTTVVGSDGTHLDGVEREEAPLPYFVYQLDGLRATDFPHPFAKGIDYRRPLAHVNVRMETPVIYFYSDQAFDAQVDVGFNGGAISQWFPDRSAGETLPRLHRNKENKLPRARKYHRFWRQAAPGRDPMERPRGTGRR